MEINTLKHSLSSKPKENFPLDVFYSIYVTNINTLCSASDTLSLQIPHTTLHCCFLRLFCFGCIYMEWPSPSSLTETLSGLIQIKSKNIYFPKIVDLPCFLFCADVLIHSTSPGLLLPILRSDLTTIFEQSERFELHANFAEKDSAVGIGTHAMFLVIPKWGCMFSVCSKFTVQYYNTSDVWQRKLSWAIGWKYNSYGGWCCITHIKCFLCTNRRLMLYVIAACS